MEQRHSGCPWLGVHRDGDQLAGDGHGAASHGHVQDHGQGERGLMLTKTGILETTGVLEGGGGRGGGGVNFIGRGGGWF